MSLPDLPEKVDPCVRADLRLLLGRLKRLRLLYYYLRGGLDLLVILDRGNVMPSSRRLARI